MAKHFRIDGRAFFLTYPKCDLERADALELLRGRMPGFSIDQYCVSREQHEDGTNHLHLLVVLDRKKTVTSSTTLDIGGHHGNYQTARNRLKVFDYITKADGDCLTNMDLASLKAKSLTRTQIGKRILDGEKLEDMVEEYPNLLFGYKRLKEDIKAFEESKTEYPSLPSFVPNPWGFLMSSGTSAKRRHWWIYSNVPNRGKTTWAKILERDYRAYIKSSDFSYWNVTGRESIVILDDYNTAGLRYNTLNQLCDGSYECRVFMAGVRKLDVRLVIVLSNVPISALYPHMNSLLHARFIEKCID